jgi:large subunit ribosomal protein L15
MRLPKLPGFKNRWRQEYEIVNVGRLEDVYKKGEVVDGDSLAAKGVVKSADDPVKVLGDGELTKALTVRVQKISASARVKIESAGGTVELT